MERLHAKIICGVVMLIWMPVCFLLPVKMVDVVARYGSRGQLGIDLLTCFAGGVFLSSYLVFMAPAVRFLIQTHLMTPNAIEFPLPDFLIGLGFFLMLALDKLVKYVNAAVQRSQPKVNGDASRPLEAPMRVSMSGARLVMSEDQLEMDCDVIDRHRRRSGSTTTTTHNGSVVMGTRAQSFVNLATASSMTTVRSAVMMMALSIDSVLEGMTIGLKGSDVEVWTIFIGIIVHESVIAFCLGLQLVRVHPTRMRPVMVACIVYSLMNPFGVTLATAVYETLDRNESVEVANGVLQALTSGCFIYVIFYEILENQIGEKTPLSKILAIFVGYVFLSSFAAIPGSSPYGQNTPNITLCQNSSVTR